MAGMNVVVISGTLGAGKTTLMWALGRELTERGYRVAVQDVDCLRGLIHPPVGDRFNERIVLAHLRAMIPNWRDVEVEVLILAVVLESPAERARYAEAVADPQMQVVRLDTSESTRRQRLTAREPAGPQLDWHLERTGELDVILRAGNVQDFAVVNEGQSPHSCAVEVANQLQLDPTAN
jgi:adenylylsulfate kinase